MIAETDALSPAGNQARLFRELMSQLGRLDRRDTKIVAALDGAQESLAVPLTFFVESGGVQSWLCSRASGELRDRVGPLLAGWVEERDRPGAFATKLKAPVELGDMVVRSVLAAPVSEPRGSGWLVAVESDPDRVLGRDELHLLALAASILKKQFQQDAQVDVIKVSLLELVRCMAAIIDAKDSCTAGHSDRVGQIAMRIGKSLALPTPEVTKLRLAGFIHDIGKIGIRDEVLTKPGKLSVEDHQHIQQHPVIGDEIISKITYFAHLRPAVRSHHERIDGNGYPDRLRGDEIPLMGRIVAVADSVDAMMSNRCYRQSMSPPQIDSILQRFAGTQWDKAVVEAFMDCREDIYPPIYRKPVGDTAMHAISELVGDMINGSSTHFKLMT